MESKSAKTALTQANTEGGKMKLKRLLNQITGLPWLLVRATDGDKWIGTANGDDRIATLDGNTQSLDHEYLLHAANVLPELLAAAKNLHDNWEHNLTGPMARLNEATAIAQDVSISTRRKRRPRPK